MKWLPLSLFFLSANCAFSQNTTLSGHLTDIPDGAYVYLAPQSWDSGSPLIDSAIVRNGHFRFRWTIAEGEGNAYVFSTYRTPVAPKKETEITGELVKDMFRRQYIYLEKGNAEVTGNAQRLDLAVWSGDLFIRDQNDYFTQIRADSGWSLISQRILRHTLGAGPLDSVTRDTILYSFFGLWYIRMEAARKWIPLHPDSPASLLALYSDLEMVGRPEKEKLLSQLSPSARANSIGKNLQKFWDSHEPH